VARVVVVMTVATITRTNATADFAARRGVARTDGGRYATSATGWSCPSAWAACAALRR